MGTFFWLTRYTGTKPWNNIPLNIKQSPSVMSLHCQVKLLFFSTNYQVYAFYYLTEVSKPRQYRIPPLLLFNVINNNSVLSSNFRESLRSHLISIRVMQGQRILLSNKDFYPRGGGTLPDFGTGTCHQGFKNIPVCYTYFSKMYTQLLPIFRKWIPDPIPIAKIAKIDTAPYTKIVKIDTVPYTEL